MTLVTGTVQDLGYDGMEGTLWARPARFRSDGQVVYAPERKPYRVVDGVVSADLAPGPAVLELQVGSHARGTFEVVIPEEDTTLADLLDTVFPWEPAQVSLFVAEREAAVQAKVDAEQAATLAGSAKEVAETAAQQTGQDRAAVASDKDTVVAHVQALAEPNDAAVLGLISEGADTATKAALNATYGRRILSASPRPLNRPANPTSPLVVTVGVDQSVPGRIFGSNRTFQPWAQSDDYGATWLNGTGPANCDLMSLQKMVTFKGHVYAYARETNPLQRMTVYRSLPADTPSEWSWVTAFHTRPGIEGKSTIFNAGSQYLFIADYEASGEDIAALGGPIAYRSSNGTTWVPIYEPGTSVKHIHCIAEDPYRPGHVYMTIGDNGTPHSVMRSTQHGAPGTWEPVISGDTGNAWQSIQISFSPDWVWLASDRHGFAVAVFDRDALVPYSVATNLPTNEAVPGGAAGDRFFELGYYGAVDPETGVYYLNQSDTSTAGNTFGNFTLAAPGGRLELLDWGKNPFPANGEVFVAGGWVFIGAKRYLAYRPAP